MLCKLKVALSSMSCRGVRALVYGEDACCAERWEGGGDSLWGMRCACMELAQGVS